MPPVTAIYQTFKPASDAEYQARVVMQNAKAAAEQLGDGDPDTPPTPAEQAAIDALDAATAAHAVTVTDLEAARVVRDAALEPFGIAMDGDNVHLPAVAPDEGLSAPFNSWFTLFGQFFDHGLDLVNKGGSGTVFIPLQPDDPLYVDGQPHQLHGADPRHGLGRAPTDIMGTADDVRPVNTTTAYVDQNQTYTSHSSHQVFLRQYVLNADGDPVATGKLIEGANGGMATWGEVKAQAASMLGIQLTDIDVGSVPLLRTDAYGNFIPAIADRLPQIITGIGVDGIPNTADDIVVVGHPCRPGQSDDGSRHPHRPRLPRRHRPRGGAGRQDRRRRHHDRSGQSRQRRHRVRQRAARRPLHRRRRPREREYRPHRRPSRVPCRAQPAGRAHQGAGARHQRPRLHQRMARRPTLALCRPPRRQVAALVWDGERLFQAAKFGTEMQYQHLVFEEFARKVQPNINVFLVPDGFDTTIDPSIVAEFAHVVYRFGHSMLTESIDRFDPAFTADHIGLIEGFLNPIAFDGAGPDRSHDHRRHRRRRHHPRHDPPGRQRDRRVRDDRAAQQPARPAARPRDHQSGARP